MNHSMIKLVGALAIASIGLFAADNSIGSWKRNIAKSHSTATVPNPYTSQSTVREAADGGAKISAMGVRKDGATTNTSYTIKYDGKPISVKGVSAYDSISIKQIDANTFTSETKKSGTKYHMKGRTTISADGKTMTLTQKGTDADGKPVSSTIVYDKQ